MAKDDIVPEVSTAEFDSFVGKGLVLVDFFAEWCMPCMMMSPIIEDLAETFKGKIKFGKVNVGETQELANRFNISSIPNFILFKNGKQLDNFVGSMSEDVFEEKLKEYL